MSVFVTDGTWDLTQSVIRSLGRNSINVFTGDCNRHNFGLNSKYCSKFIIYPSPNSETFISYLSDIIKDLDVDVLIPIGDDSTFQISKYKSKLEKITKVPVPNQETIIKAFDKLETVKSAQKIGLLTPKTYNLNNEQSTNSFLKEVKFPLILKPRFGGRGSIGLFLVNTTKEFIWAYKSIIKNSGEPIVQEYIPGKSVCMHMVNILFNKKSKPVASFTARKIHEYPFTGGITTLGESTYNSEIIKYSTKLLESWNWYGVAEVEFKKDPRDNNYKIIEVNPRFWQYVQLPIYCGVDFPFLLYKMALNENLKQPDNYSTGIKYINPFKDPLSIIQMLKKSQNKRKDIYNNIMLYRGKKIYSLLSISDPCPVLGKIPKIIRRV